MGQRCANSLPLDRFTVNEPMQEVWRPVVGWEGLYSVSDWGRVRREARVTTNGARLPQRLRSPGVNREGYRVVRLQGNGRAGTYNVATLVALAFLGPRPEKQVVRHGTGGQLDDSLANLCWGTEKENCADKLRDGTHQRGEQSGRAKLTVEQVRFARHLYDAKEKGAISRLAREWNVSLQTVWLAATRKQWAWLDAA